MPMMTDFTEEQQNENGVHISTVFYVDQTPQVESTRVEVNPYEETEPEEPEAAVEAHDGAEREDDDAGLAPASSATARAPSSASADCALDATPVATPPFKCRAADPCRCRFHGAQALTDRLQSYLKAAGVESATRASVTRADDKGRGAYRVDLVVSPADLSAAQAVLARFGSADGVSFEPPEPKSTSSEGKPAVSFEDFAKVDYLDPDAGEGDGHGVSPASASFEPMGAESPDPPVDPEPWKAVENFVLEASKTVSRAAKTVNRHVDKGDFTPHTGKVTEALALRDGLLAAYLDPTTPATEAAQSDALLRALDDMEKSSKNGWKDRVRNVPMYTLPTDHPAPLEPDLAGVATEEEIVADGGETAATLRALASDLPDESPTRAALIAEAKRQEAILAEHRRREEAEKKAGEAKPEGGDAPAAEPVATPTEEAKLTGFGIIEDGDTVKDVIRKRAANGLREEKALTRLQRKIDVARRNVVALSRELAAKYDDPDLDLSDPAVYDRVERNYAATVKRIFSTGRIVSWSEPDRILSFLREGRYMTHYKSDDERRHNFRHLYDLTPADDDYAPISAMIASPDPVRMFETPCSNRFGPICIEWRKDSGLVPLFSNCDAAEPASDDARKHSRWASEHTYMPSLASDPKLCSLSMGCDGAASIVDHIGVKSASGKPMTSWANAVKLLRKGPIEGDAHDFDVTVNGADKSPGPDPRSGRPIPFGWNECPLVGQGYTSDVCAIHVNTAKWNEMAKKYYDHGTKYMTSEQFVAHLKSGAESAYVRKNGIKIFVDGKELKPDD